MAKTPISKKVVTLVHEEASRKNIPTAEYQSVMRTDEQSPVRIAYGRRNHDLDPQLVWRGKDVQDWSDLVVSAPPLYIQEKVHPKVLIDDLRRTTETATEAPTPQFDLFADFNGLPSEDAKTEFYQHDAHWSNRMILGDSLQVMASLAERESLRSKVQCIFLDPPYGIKFNSNFQWSTTSRDVRDGNVDHITREPEQVKAFRDTWRDGIHSYLTYLRDRLTVARELLSESGSIFVQIGDENVHRIRVLMDEVFGDTNFVSEIVTQKTGGFSASRIPNTNDYLLWYAKSIEQLKFRPSLEPLERSATEGQYQWVTDKVGFSRGLTADEKRGLSPMPAGTLLYQPTSLTSQGASAIPVKINFQGKPFSIPENQHWKTTPEGLERLKKASRIHEAKNSLRYVRLAEDYPVKLRTNTWTDTATGNFTDEKIYVVQTSSKAIERCVLMTTDPGDLVLDPTCGSGTTAFVSEEWGRRWITIDTSRVALALARARVMGARYPYYLLSDSREGQAKEAVLAGRVPSTSPVHENVRLGFVYERVPHIMLSQIANNAEIDVIWQTYEEKLEPIREQLNKSLAKDWEPWNIPRQSVETWPKMAKQAHEAWWELRIARQKDIDASIAIKSEPAYLFDKPFQDSKRVRVAGPFTVESLSPHRVLAVEEDGTFADSDTDGEAREAANFVQVILDNLKTSGVQQAHKGDKIVFSSLAPWPGERVCAEGRYVGVDGSEKRAAVFIGPEFGTVSRPDLVSAARESGDAGFDVLIACAFNYDAHSSDFTKLGRIPVLKARMNADLHMATDLKNTGKGNLFVIFGEPEIEIMNGSNGQVQVKVLGIDVFHPATGIVRSDGPDGIACWFVDTDYNEESFFVRQAYFLGANDPYKSLKTTLKAEINEEAWATLHSDTSRCFPKPTSGRIAVKVINHLGDEVMKVFKVS
jgi:adenine-specific DNA-methyltransferase